MERLPRDVRWAGWSAIAGVAIFAAANALWALDQPPPNATGPELVDFYDETATRIIIGGSLSLVSIAVFVVFGAAISSVIARLQRDDLLAKVVFGGVVLGCAGGIGAEGVNLAAAVRADDGTLSDPLAEALFDVSFVYGSYTSGIGFGLAMIGIGAAARQTRAMMPGWLAILFIVVGVALVTPLLFFLVQEYSIAASFILLFGLGVRLLRGSAEPRPPETP